ncbi:kinase-like protein [Teratosphaeria nubilosa]|uniref:Kinase-like protein n=1 Tax=Teratosphaeria nubilosa TaxID=161662 RepID=A0A6G1KWD6_9PEZI|nr:kinase-like protein [Teratosphaeria nubilosa]
MGSTQSDHLPELQQFHSWIEEITVTCESPTSNDSVEKARFVPYRIIERKFNEGNHAFVRKLRDAVLGEDSCRVNAADIVKDCPRIFCILLSIGQGPFILHFATNDSLHDSCLPLSARPDRFPTGHDDFWQKFDEMQWKFCVPFLSSSSSPTINPKKIMPFVRRERLDEGGSATVDLVKVHPDYDHLERRTQEGRVSSCNHCYVLKTYTGLQAKHYYDREVEAFMRLSNHQETLPSPTMIGYYGSYIYRETYNIILEYANEGTFEHYMQKRQPPSEGDDIIAFWRSLLDVSKALSRLHEQSLDETDYGRRSILQGWHQDIKPKNILVLGENNKSPYRWTFKLADLGLSHFKQINRGAREATDQYSFGTRTYGAPECYAWSEFSEQQRLNIKRSTDIWSFGCVLSEAAVWVVLGWQGVERYRRHRLDDTDKPPHFRGGDCFHNGKGKRRSVDEMHRQIRDNLRRSDFITGDVVDEIVKHMLHDQADARLHAKQLIYRADSVIEEACQKLKSSRTSSSSHDARPSTLAHPRWRASTISKLPVIPDIGFTESPRGSIDQFRGIQTGNFDPNESASRSPQPRMPGTDEIGNSRMNKTPERLSNGHVHNDILDPRFSQGLFVDRNGEQGEYAAIAGPATALKKSMSVRSSPTPTLPSSRSPILESESLRRPQQDWHPHRSKVRPAVFASDTAAIGFQSRTHTSFSVVAGAEEQEEAQVYASQAVPPHSATANSHSTSNGPPGKLIKTMKDPLPFLSVQKAISWRSSRRRDPLDHPTYRVHLDQRDHMFLVDDSNSMASFWGEMKALLGALAYMVKDCDPDGIELFFMNDKRTEKSKKSSALVELAGLVRPSGTVDARMRLGDLIRIFDSQNSSRSFWRLGRSRDKGIRGLNIYVLTTGIWQPRCDLAKTIEGLVQRLQQRQVDQAPIGIEFIRFGNDPAAIMKLDHLDSGLGLPLDIVDHEPSNGNVWKMLLGAINSWFDDDAQSQRSV